MEPRRALSIPGKIKPYVMAHRGNRARCPENTLASFRQALEDGADILETDLHLSADGHFMCIHDASVDRTTNGSGHVAEKTRLELIALDASKGWPGFVGERIPELVDLAQILPPDVALALELKTDRFLEQEVCSRLAKVLDQNGVRNRTVVLSFSLARIKAVQAAAPDIPTGWITIRGMRPIRGVQLLGPFWPILMGNPAYVWMAHRRGQAVCPLDPVPEKRLWYYRFLGCDALLTDDPAKTVKALGRQPREADTRERKMAIVQK